MSRISLIESAVHAAARADTRLLLTLEKDSRSDTDVVSETVTEAVTLMLAVGALWQRDLGRAENQHPQLVQQFWQRLSGHEEAVLAGEATYSLRLEDGEQAAARIRQAIGRLTRDEGSSQPDLVSLRSEAIDLAALLVRAAANAAASGSASEAPEQRTAALDRTLDAITRELAARAQRVERPVDAGGDVVAHHLAAGLRVRVAQETLDDLAASSASQMFDAACLDDAKEAWFRLATNEYVAVVELGSELETPAYADTFGSLSDAIVEGAANVICGARLGGRPGSFRHRRAWGHQATALTYALEAYVAGLRGDPSSFAQAQLLTLTRLTRATAAIAMLELRRAAILPTNGRPRR
jgi:hypothetical protein